jgi:hypothetical protein
MASIPWGEGQSPDHNISVPMLQSPATSTAARLKNSKGHDRCLYRMSQFDCFRRWLLVRIFCLRRRARGDWKLEPI